MDKFVVEARPPKDAWRDSRVTIRIPCKAYENIRGISKRANIPITQIIALMRVTVEADDGTES